MGMMAKRGLALAVAGLLAGATEAKAQVTIGGATLIEQDVRGTVNGRTSRIAVGDAVFQDQRIATGRDAAAKLTFTDSTALAIGPASTVKLDQFVYAGGGQVAAVFNATRGAFRFVSGRFRWRPYEVQTPQAIVGVRGTIFGVRVQPALTTIVLQAGAVSVCLRARPQVCTELTLAKTYVTVSATAIKGPFPITRGAWTFDRVCRQGGSSELCGRTTGQAP